MDLNRLIKQKIILFLLLVFQSFWFALSGSCDKVENVGLREEKDSADIQVIYNGRAWRNLYYRVRGDQFLFIPIFIQGSVSIEGRKYDNLLLSYDIFNDELLINTQRGILIQLNKEMVDSFSLEFNYRNYKFKRLDTDSVNSITGYVNVLHDAGLSLFVKYRKEILPLAVDNKYDLFSQSNRIYLKKDGIIYRIGSKGEFLNLLKDHKQEVHRYIKNNKIQISRTNPDGMAQVIEFYEKLRQ